MNHTDVQKEEYSFNTLQVNTPFTSRGLQTFCKDLNCQGLSTLGSFNCPEWPHLGPLHPLHTHPLPQGST